MLLLCSQLLRLKAMPRTIGRLATIAGVTFMTSCATDGRVSAPPIDLPLELRSGMPTVTVDIGGKPLRLFVDLGGYSAVGLTSGELRQVHVEYLSESIRSTNAAGEINESRRFAVPDVALGGVSLGELAGSEFIFAADAAPPDRNGYIGFALLSRFLLVIDYPSRSLRLFRSGEPGVLLRECGPKTFEVQVVDGVAQSTAKTDYGWRVFSWDTGSTRNVIRPSVVGRADTRATMTREITSQRVTSFVLGGHEFGPQQFAVIGYPALGVDGVLGTDFFSSRVVCLDIPQGIGAAR